MKIFITLLAFLNGAFMLIDGIYVMLKGKYIGPDKPGPWAQLFYLLKVNVFNLGPLFICYGIAWLLWIYALWAQQSWAYSFGLFVSIMSLWYLPVGSLFSLVILATLFFAKQKVGL